MHYRDDGREEYDNGGSLHGVRVCSRVELGELKKIVIATNHFLYSRRRDDRQKDSRP